MKGGPGGVIIYTNRKVLRSTIILPQRGKPSLPWGGSYDLMSRHLDFHGPPTNPILGGIPGGATPLLYGFGQLAT